MDLVQDLRDIGQHTAANEIERLTEIRDTREVVIQKQHAEIGRLRAGLEAAIRAADLALFVIRKQGVMPNDSWKDGFERDLKAAKDALTAAK